MDLKAFEIPGKVYIYENLCPFYKSLRFKCKKIWEKEMIDSFWVSGGKIYIKLNPTDDRVSISHNIDLQKLFPNENLEMIYNTADPPRN